MSGRRRTTRRPKAPPRCQHCRRQITWLVAPSGSGWRPFDPAPVDPDDASVLAGAYPVTGKRAWDFNELIAEVQVMHGYDVVEAKNDVLAMRWHRLHRCGERVAAARAERENAPQ